MGFGICKRRYVMWWHEGERDLAEALAEIEGYRVARAGAGLVDAEKTCRGRWERKIELACVRKTRERDRERYRRKKQEARCAN